MFPPLILPLEAPPDRVVDGLEYERFIEGLFTAFGNGDSFFEYVSKSFEDAKSHPLNTNPSLTSHVPSYCSAIC